MKAPARTAQLHIRLTSAEKAMLARAARRSGMDMSAYVLERVLPQEAGQWAERLKRLANSNGDRFELAGLSAWLAGLGAGELTRAVATPPPPLSDFDSNYVAAMVEHLCNAAGIGSPSWTRDIAPLALPAFGSELMSLRIHLLSCSPAAYRRRNIFIDTPAGGQV